MQSALCLWWKEGWSLSNTTGLDSRLNILSRSNSKSTNFLPNIASAAFDHEITLDFLSSVSFFEPTVDRCSCGGRGDKGLGSYFLFSSVALLPSLFPRSHTKLLADAAALGNRRTSRGAMFVHPTETKCVCDHREGLMIACVFSRGPCVLGGPHCLINIWLTVIGYCCVSCGLVSLPVRPATYSSSLSSRLQQHTRRF